MRILFVLSFFYLSLFAEASAYIGISIEDSSELFVLNNNSMSASTPLYKIKAGYGDIGGYAVEAAFSYMDYATNVFSPNDGPALMLDLTLYKGWDVGHNLYPYLDVGMGMGDMKVERQLEKSLAFSSFNVGAGIRYVIDRTYDFDFGVSYKFRSWQTISLVAEEVDVTSHVLNPYIGINYHF